MSGTDNHANKKKKPNREEVKEEVHKIIRRATIDLNQAEAALDASQYPRYKENLEAVVLNLQTLLKATKHRL